MSGDLTVLGDYPLPVVGGQRFRDCFKIPNHPNFIGF